MRWVSADRGDEYADIDEGRRGGGRPFEPAPALTDLSGSQGKAFYPPVISLNRKDPY